VKPVTHTHKTRTHERVLTGTGAGYSGKPQGSPWHSLVASISSGLYLTCLHKIPSSMWASGLHLNYWYVLMKSHLACELLGTSGLYLNHWHVFMKSCLACELLGNFWAPFESLTCLLWNCVQDVSFWAPPRIYLNHWHAFYEILSSMWVSGHLPGSIWIIDMPSMKSCPACELLGTSQALFESLTFYEILSSMWVAGHLPGSIWITDMPSMKSCPGCELLGISQALFESLTCPLQNPV